MTTNTLPRRTRRPRECPADIAKALRDWGLTDEYVGVVYPVFANHFNKQTIVQAVVLRSIALREQPITVRGVFYRGVSAGLYPDTSDRYYRQCGEILLRLRRSRLLAYNCIVDSTRRRLKPSSWSGLSDFAEDAAKAYRKDLWARQTDYVEVFVEKDAMAAVIEPVTREFDIYLNVIRGNCSESFVWQIAEIWREVDKPIYAYYLGDHDPQGMAIERDLRSRLTDMSYRDVEWERLAITDADFFSDMLGFPIKGNRRDAAWLTRNGRYLEEYGDRCVEVDALPPHEIRDRIRETVESHIDGEEWARLQSLEKLERDCFNKFVLAQRNAESQADGRSPADDAVVREALLHVASEMRKQPPARYQDGCE